MNAKLQRLREDPGRLITIEVRPRAPAKEIVAELMVERKAYYREAMAVKGRFASRAELIGFLSDRLSEGSSSLATAAADAGITLSTLRHLIYSGKVGAAHKKEALIELQI